MTLGPYDIPGSYVGNARDLLRELPDDCVHSVATSPPYWGLRDYGIEPVVWGGDAVCEHAWESEEVATEIGKGNWAQATNGRGERQPGGLKEKREPSRSTAACSTCVHCGAWRGSLGLEPTPELFVEHLTTIFAEVRRVLRPDGLCWINLGDSYSERTSGTKSARRDGANVCVPRKPNSRPKNLLGLPWRVALALQADGWTLRDCVVWHKPNTMPESVRDRTAKAHEYLFLLSKRPRYFSDFDAIREPQTGNAHSRGNGATPKAAEPGSGIKANESFQLATAAWHESSDQLRHPRSVWSIPTTAYGEAHFATFPEELAKRMVLSSSSPKACGRCLAPYARVVDRDRTFESGSGKSGAAIAGKGLPPTDGQIRANHDVRRGPTSTVRTVGWQPTCRCEPTDDTGRCIVLDPFLGSGTVAKVALASGRDFLGFDANADYVAMQQRRLGFLADRVAWEGAR